MKKILILLLGVGSLISAQLSYNNGSFVCPLGAIAFCAGDSLETNIIVRCIGTGGIAGNCNDNLAGVPPVGVKTFAPCYQSSPIAGDAACSFNGTVYPDGKPPFPVPTETTKPTAPVSTGTGGLGGSSMTTVTTTIIETGVTKTVTVTVPCSTSTSVAVTTTTSFAPQPSGPLPPYPSQHSGSLPPHSSRPSSAPPPYPSSNTTTSIVPVVPIPGIPGTGTGAKPNPTPTTTAYTYPLPPPPSSTSTPWYVPSSLSSSYPPKSPSAPTSSVGTPTGTSTVTSSSTVAPSSGALPLIDKSIAIRSLVGLLLTVGIMAQV